MITLPNNISVPEAGDGFLESFEAIITAVAAENTSESEGDA